MKYETQGSLTPYINSSSSVSNSSVQKSESSTKMDRFDYQMSKIFKDYPGTSASIYAAGSGTTFTLGLIYAMGGPAFWPLAITLASLGIISFLLGYKKRYKYLSVRRKRKKN